MGQSPLNVSVFTLAGMIRQKCREDFDALATRLQASVTTLT
jgi:hypothetical protein